MILKISRYALVNIVQITVFITLPSLTLPAELTANTAALPATPATKIEAFKPAAGTIATFGYNELGDIAGIAIDAREIKDSKGSYARGVVVEIKENQYRDERAFIDVDELPELLKGMEALLGVQSNPTPFKNFEVRYTTKGELCITAFNYQDDIRYSVEVGRISKVRKFIDRESLKALRDKFSDASNELSALPARYAPK